MKILKIIAASLVLSASSHAAISITIEPTFSGSTWSLTQTSAAPILNISGLSGYAIGLQLPYSMFHLASSEIPVTPAIGGLGGTLAVVSELVSGAVFTLGGLQISSSPLSDPSLLPFNSVWKTSGHGTAQFQIVDTNAIETSIPLRVYNPGVHTIHDTLFGTITVTVIPEPSAPILFTSAALGLLYRRRRY